MDAESSVLKRIVRMVRRRNREDGNALVELAFILPVFLAIISGIGTFGVALANKQTLVNATTIGAEQLQKYSAGGGTGDPCAETFTAIQNAASSLNANNITLSISINGDGPSGGTGSSGATCTGEQSALATAGANSYPITVSTSYPCNLSVYGYQFASSCTLKAQLTLSAY